MKKILILLTFAAAALGAQAKLGYMRTTLSYNPISLSSNANGGFYETIPSTLYGGSLNFNLGIKMFKGLYLETGAGSRVNGGKGVLIDDITKTTDDWDDFLNSSIVMVRLNVPVNLAYRFEFAKIFTLTPYAGLNLGFNLYAYNGMSLFAHSGDVITDHNGWQYTYSPNRFQMGWQAGVNFSVIGITVGIGYQGDFTAFDRREYLPEFQQQAIDTYGTDEPKIKTGNLVVTLGFGF